MIRIWGTRLFVAFAVGWTLGALAYLVLRMVGVSP